MQRTGEFRDGYYITIDSDGNEHRADGRNAVWESFTKQKMIYPTPRYQQPIVVEPTGFDWRPLGGGIYIKMLGRFTEDDVYLASYRWTVGATLTLTPERTQLLWISSGAVDLNGATYGAWYGTVRRVRRDDHRRQQDRRSGRVLRHAGAGARKRSGADLTPTWCPTRSSP